MINPAFETIVRDAFMVKSSVRLYVCNAAWEHLHTMVHVPTTVWAPMNLGSIWGIPISIDETIEEGTWELRSKDVLLAKGPFEVELPV